MFFPILIIFENWSDIYEAKTFLVLQSQFLLVAASLCIFQVHTEKIVQHHSEVECQSPCENKYGNFCLKIESFDLVDQNVVGCKSSQWYGRKRCEKNAVKLG